MTLDVDYNIPEKLNININREILQCNIIKRLLRNNVITFNDLLSSTSYITFENGCIIPEHIEGKNISLQNERNKIINYKSTNTTNVLFKLKKQLVRLSYDNIIVKYPYNLYKIIYKQILPKYKKDINIDIYNNILFISYLRYTSFGLYNGYMGSIKRSIYNELIDKHSLQLELFGSLFNHTAPYYG